MAVFRSGWLAQSSLGDCDAAKPFYERAGYSVFGILEDYPPGHTRYFMRKDLPEPGADGA